MSKYGLMVYGELAMSEIDSTRFSRTQQRQGLQVTWWVHHQKFKSGYEKHRHVIITTEEWKRIGLQLGAIKG
jgi:hypothetical protein